MKVNSPIEFLFDQLRHLHGMEVQIARSLPVLAGSVMNIWLRKLLSDRALRARDRRDQVGGLLDRHGETDGPVVCTAIKGILNGGNMQLAEVGNPFTRDLVMVCHCMLIEHHAIAAYRINSSLAERASFRAEARQLAGFQSELEFARTRLQSLQSELFRTATFHPSAGEFSDSEPDSRVAKKPRRAFSISSKQITPGALDPKASICC